MAQGSAEAGRIPSRFPASEHGAWVSAVQFEQPSASQLLWADAHLPPRLYLLMSRVATAGASGSILDARPPAYRRRFLPRAQRFKGRVGLAAIAATREGVGRRRAARGRKRSPTRTRAKAAAAAGGPSAREVEREAPMPVSRKQRRPHRRDAIGGPGNVRQYRR